MSTFKTSYIYTAVVALIASLSISAPASAAFPVVDFGSQTVMADRYRGVVDRYDGKFQEYGVSRSKRAELYEKRIGQAYASLAKAKTGAVRKRYETLIVRYSKLLDAEIARIRKNSSRTTWSPVGANTSGDSTSSVWTIPDFVDEKPSWSGATPADFLYYSDQFEGKYTSNGNTFRQAGFSAARCNVPLNSLLQLRYGDSGIIVKANDRPNCTKHPDIVDLTTGAFSRLAPITKGRLAGTVVPLGTLSTETVKEFLPRDYFKWVGIRLESNTPNLYLPNETFHLKGEVLDGKTETLIYLVTPSGKTVSYGMDNLSVGKFEYTIPLSEIGVYDFVVASGRAFSWVRALSFEVLDPGVLQGKQYFKESVSATGVRISGARREASDLSALHVVDVSGLPDSTFRSVNLKGKNTEISRSWMGTIAFAPSELSGFSVWEEVLVTVTGRQSSTPFSQDTITPSRRYFAERMILAPAYKPEKGIEYVSSVKDRIYTLQITTEPERKISGTAYIITPSGKVDKIQLSGESRDSRGVLASAKGSSFKYTLKETGVYLIEVNYDNGFAAVIEPVSNGNVLSILPNAYDSTPRMIEADRSRVADDMLASINLIRKNAGLSSLVSDETLAQVAEYKAKDMADRNYVGHADSQGVYIRDTAKRAGIVITTSMGENVAGWTVSAAFLQAGLSLSGAHRSNMLGDWKKVGIGIIVKNGKVYVAQVFGD